MVVQVGGGEGLGPEEPQGRIRAGGRRSGGERTMQEPGGSRPEWTLQVQKTLQFRGKRATMGIEQVNSWGASRPRPRRQPRQNQ